MRHGICSWIVASLCVLVSGGCAKKDVGRIDAGKVEGSVYRNEYLGFTLRIPSDWSVQDRKAQEEQRRTGEKMLSGDNKSMQAMFESGASRTVDLIMLFKYPPGSPVSFNPNIAGVAENVAHAPGIRTGGDYLFHYRRVLQASQAKFSFTRDVYTETIGGAEFHVLTTETSPLPATVVKQEHYATVRKGYVVVLVLSFTTDEERKALRDVLDTGVFEPL
jgi:hypothetical protein